MRERKFTTEEILGWVAKERDYHHLRGFWRAKTLKDEIEFAEKLLAEAKRHCPEGADYTGKPRATTINMRRIAANFVRALEWHGIYDQGMQLVRDCTVTITREGEERAKKH